MLNSELPPCDDPVEALNDPLAFVWPTSCPNEEDPLPAVDDPIPPTPAAETPAGTEDELENATTGSGLLIQTPGGTAIWFPTTDLENVLGTPANGIVLITGGVPSIILPAEGEALVTRDGAWTTERIPIRVPMLENLGTITVDNDTEEVAITDADPTWLAATCLGIFAADSSVATTFTIGTATDKITFTLQAGESAIFEFTVGLTIAASTATLSVTISDHTDASVQLNLQAIWQ